MSIPDPPKWIERHMTALILICVIGTIICFIGFVFLVVQNGKRASEGSAARARQMKVYPVSVKVYEAAWRRGDITLAELNCFRTGRGCPVHPSKSP